MSHPILIKIASFMRYRNLLLFSLISVSISFGYYIYDHYWTEDDFLHGHSTTFVENLIIEFNKKTKFSENFKSVDFLSALKSAKSSSNYAESDSKYWEQLMIEMAVKNVESTGSLILAISNSGDYLLTLNFIKSLQLQGYSHFLIACLDVGLYVKLSSMSFVQHIALVPRNWLNEEISSKYVKWDSATYNSLTKSKSLIVQRLLHLNFTVMVNDVDTVWLSPHIIEYIAVLAASPAELVIMDGKSEYNSGFYLVKPTSTMLKLFDRAVELQNRDPNFHDQLALNTAIDQMSIKATYICKLDILLFVNGYFFLTQKYNEKMNVKPWVVHMNFLIGKSSKIHALKSHKLWFIDD